MDHRAVAARDQNVSNAFTQLRALRDGVQMCQAFGPGRLNEIVIAQAGRCAEHRAGDVDRLVVGEHAHDFQRCVVGAGEAFGQLDARFGLDAGGQRHQYVVEQFDLRGGVASRAVHEQVGHERQRPGALLRRAARHGLLKFLDQGRNIGHDGPV